MQNPQLHRVDSRRSLIALLLAFVVVITLLESGGLLTWAQRLEIGPLRRIALPAATLLHERLAPLGVERLRERALAGLDRLQGDGMPANAPAAVIADATHSPATTTTTTVTVPATVSTSTTTPTTTAASAVTAASSTQTNSPPLPSSSPSQQANATAVDLDAASLANIVLPKENDLPPLLPLTPPDRPRVVALVGDSMMAVSLGGNLLRGMAGHKQLTPVRAFRSGTGLIRPDVFNWITQYPPMLGDQRPDVIIVAIGANDAQGFVDNGKVISFGSDAWLNAYQARVSAFLDMLTQNGAQVIWVGLPPMRLDRYSDHIDTINRVTYHAVSLNPHARWWSVMSRFGDAKGRYIEYGQGINGKVIRLRTDDGIHISDEGSKLLSAPLLAWLAPPETPMMPEAPVSAPASPPPSPPPSPPSSPPSPSSTAPKAAAPSSPAPAAKPASTQNTSSPKKGAK